MTRISSDNTYAKVEGDAFVKAEVRRLLTYRPEGYQFTKAYKKKRWDGWKCLYNVTASTFPAGLVPMVVSALKRQHVDVEVVDVRTRPEGHIDIPICATLKIEPHQEEAVTRILQEGRGVVHHPVGAGKSIVIVEATRRLGLRTLILVNRKELLQQQYDHFQALCPEARMGMMGDGVSLKGDWVVGTIQTLGRRLGQMETWEETVEWLTQFEAVFIDECHHLPAATYGLLLRTMPNAYYRIGLSATPFGGGQVERELNVTGLTGPVISEYNSEEGVEMGRLVPADIFLVNPGGYTLPRGETDYPSEVRYGIMEHETRNELIVRLAQMLGSQGPTIVLTERIAHGKALRSLLLDEGLEEVV